jgi:hypothetical protein
MIAQIMKAFGIMLSTIGTALGAMALADAKHAFPLQLAAVIVTGMGAGCAVVAPSVVSSK